jgi:hypothetical protein
VARAAWGADVRSSPRRPPPAARSRKIPARPAGSPAGSHAASASSAHAPHAQPPPSRPPSPPSRQPPPPRRAPHAPVDSVCASSPPRYALRRHHRKRAVQRRTHGDGVTARSVRSSAPGAPSAVPRDGRSFSGSAPVGSCAPTFSTATASALAPSATDSASARSTRGHRSPPALKHLRRRSTGRRARGIHRGSGGRSHRRSPHRVPIPRRRGGGVRPAARARGG